MRTDNFRLALLTAGGRLPRWMWQAIEAAMAKGQLALVLVADSSQTIASPGPWILDAYRRWEAKRYRPAVSLLDDIAVPSLPGLLRCPTLEAGRLSSLCTEHNVDVLVVCPPLDQPACPMSVPVWKVQFGDGQRKKDLRPGFWEVIERSPTFVSLTEAAAGSASANTLETIVVPTDPRSWIRSELGIAERAAILLGRWLPPSPVRQIPSIQQVPIPARGESERDISAARAVGRQIGRFLHHGISTMVEREQWQIAIESTTDIFRLVKPEILRPPRDRFWADPFPFLKDGTFYIFLEEYLYSTGRGWISVTSRKPSGEWSAPEKVMDLGYHLSYPFVFEHAGELFMLPETVATGRLELYKCIDFPARWQLDTVLLENFKGVDSTLLEHEKAWWLFVSAVSGLHLFHSESLRGPWKAHPGNPVKADSRTARPAGRVFRMGNDWIRPAQDCALSYGREVVFNKIVKLTADSFEEVEIGRLSHPWKRVLGCHTFNRVGDTTVVDRMVMQRRW
jgi:hypothetical protein